MSHENGFHGVVEIGVEGQFDAPDAARLGPTRRQPRRGIFWRRYPRVRLQRRARHPIAHIFGSEEVERRIDLTRQVAASRATAG